MVSGLRSSAFSRWSMVSLCFVSLFLTSHPRHSRGGRRRSIEPALPPLQPLHPRGVPRKKGRKKERKKGKKKERKGRGNRKRKLFHQRLAPCLSDIWFLISTINLRSSASPISLQSAASVFKSLVNATWSLVSCRCALVSTLWYLLCVLWSLQSVVSGHWPLLSDLWLLV